MHEITRSLNTMSRLFEHFSDNAMDAMLLAQREASSNGRDWVDTEHILVGLIGCAGDSGRFLEANGVTAQAVRAEIEGCSKQGASKNPTNLPFTDSVSSVLNQAKKVSLSCGDSNITSGHLLWGLLKNQDTLGATILKKLGLAGEAAIENLQIALQSEKSLDGYTRRKR